MFPKCLLEVLLHNFSTMGLLHRFLFHDSLSLSNKNVWGLLLRSLNCTLFQAPNVVVVAHGTALMMAMVDRRKGWGNCEALLCTWSEKDEGFVIIKVGTEHRSDYFPQTVFGCRGSRGLARVLVRYRVVIALPTSISRCKVQSEKRYPQTHFVIFTKSRNL
jgi:hypothetical protein